MGAPIGWIAVRGMDRSQIMGILEMEEAFPGKRLAANMFSLPNGWTVVLTFDFGFPTPERLTALSANEAAVALSLEDHVMFSVVRGYEHGAAVFAIEHDAEQGIRHIATAGTPPAEWPAILDRLSKEQDEEDRGDAMVDYIFDAPTELAKALCGYRHDEDWAEGEEPSQTPLMTNSASVPAKKPSGFLARLFGR